MPCSLVSGILGKTSLDNSNLRLFAITTGFCCEATTTDPWCGRWLGCSAPLMQVLHLLEGACTGVRAALVMDASVDPEKCVPSFRPIGCPVPNGWLGKPPGILPSAVSGCKRAPIGANWGRRLGMDMVQVGSMVKLFGPSISDIFLQRELCLCCV